MNMTLSLSALLRAIRAVTKFKHDIHLPLISQ